MEVVPPMLTLNQLWTTTNRCHGAWSTIPSPVSVEILGRAGFDFVTIDLQHSFTTIDALPALTQALHHTPARTVVRVPWNTPDQIMRAFDLGAEAVIVPLINSADEARVAVAASRYAPAGNRSWGPIWSNSRHDPIEPDQGDAHATCVVMIETARGLENIDEICRVDDLGAVYIGPNDLSLSLGLGRVGFRESTELHRAMLEILSTASSHGVPVGIDCADTADAHYWSEQGAAFTMSTSDALLLRQAADATAAGLHEGARAL